MNKSEPEAIEVPSSEDEADAAIFAERMADLAAGRDERLSPEVSKTMLEGRRFEVVRVQTGTPPAA